MTDDKNTRLDPPEVLRVARRLRGASDDLAKSKFDDVNMPAGAFGGLPVAQRLQRLHDEAQRLNALANTADVEKLSEFSIGVKASVEYLDDADREAEVNLARLARAEPEGGW
ncbi:hypothetical protein [Nocardioides pacificus]